MLLFKRIIKENSVSHQSPSWTETFWVNIFFLYIHKYKPEPDPYFWTIDIYGEQINNSKLFSSLCYVIIKPSVLRFPLDTILSSPLKT